MRAGWPARRCPAPGRRAPRHRGRSPRRCRCACRIAAAQRKLRRRVGIGAIRSVPTTIPASAALSAIVSRTVRVRAVGRVDAVRAGVDQFERRHDVIGGGVDVGGRDVGSIERVAEHERELDLDLRVEVVGGPDGRPATRGTCSRTARRSRARRSSSPCCIARLVSPILWPVTVGAPATWRSIQAGLDRRTRRRA